MTVNVKAMTPEERRAWLREIGRRGGQARAQTDDFPEHQRRAGRRSAAANDMAAPGHRGAMAHIQEYGYAGLFRLARAWRLENPSRHERAIIAMLDELGLIYEREAEVLGAKPFVSVDFYLPATRQVIEVNGRVHYDERFDHPRYPQTRQLNESQPPAASAGGRVRGAGGRPPRPGGRRGIDQTADRRIRRLILPGAVTDAGQG